MSDELVSVVIPVYNGAPFVGKPWRACALRIIPRWKYLWSTMDRRMARRMS